MRHELARPSYSAALPAPRRSSNPHTRPHLMKRITTAWRTTALVLFASIAAACDDGGTGSRPAVAITPHTPATFTTLLGVVNAALVTSPAVRVFDDRGTGVPGITVNFAVTSGGGTITGPTAVTNFDGVAAVGSWVLGTTAGANTLVATPQGVTLPAVTFIANGNAGAAVTITKVSGDAQTDTAGTLLESPFVVRLNDAFGNVVPATPVTFAVASGGGTVAPATPVLTNAQGTASARLTLGRTIGAQTVTATTAGVAPTTFTVTARTGAATAIAKVAASDNQSAPVNSGVPVPPTVLLTDVVGNPVSGVVVTFMVASGGGRVGTTTATTGADGRATSGFWVLGPAAGPNTVTATAAGVSGTVTFTATGTAL